MRAFERQGGESAKAYAAFSLYRDLGPERSLAKAAETYYGSTSNLRQFSTWSSRFDWVARARAYDDHVEMIRRDTIEQYEQSQATDLAVRLEALREQTFTNEEHAARIEAKLLDRAERLIDELPLAAMKNAVADAVRLHKIATRNEPTVSKVDITKYDFDSMTDEQLERIAAGEDPARVLGNGT